MNRDGGTTVTGPDVDGHVRESNGYSQGRHSTSHALHQALAGLSVRLTVRQ